jgi:GGDEF domain-containing protein
MSELEQVLGKEFARAARYREPLALLLLDVAPTGEALGTIRDGVRLCDSVIPAGATRVAVVLPETPLAGALEVATRLGAALVPADAASATRPFAAGIGVGPSQQASDAGALLRCAGSALDQARSRGGGVASQ